MGKLTMPPSRLSRAPYRLGIAPGESDQRRRDVSPWRRWYDTAEWKRLRLDVFKRDHFTCQWPGCGRIQADTSQLVCDHIEPHRGQRQLFFLRTNLQTLCKSPCHDQHKQALEQASRHRGGIWG